MIVATLNRTDDVERLLASLDQQTYRDLEVLVVDQNADDRLAPILNSHPKLVIHHLHSPRGLSRARNAALLLAKGDFICFPDDDCWYPREVLAAVIAWFGAHAEFGALFACLRDADNKPVGPKWPQEACVCTKDNVWDIGVSASAFLRRDIVRVVGPFDENIGIGCESMYQSGEESDYFLRMLEQGSQMWFEPALTVCHPSLHTVDRLRRKSFTYALGSGYVRRVHEYSWLDFGQVVIRSLGGAALSLLKADFENVQIYVLRAAGQLRGYIWGPHELSRRNSRMG